jgi:hypothetical protein
MNKKLGFAVAFMLAVSFSVSTQPNSIDLIQKSRTAQWFNDRGMRLPFPGRDSDIRGFARLITSVLEDGQSYSNVLETHPRWETQGWIEGRFPLNLPQNASFEATVGFLRGASATDGVIFEVLWKEGNRENILATVKKLYNGNLASLSADLYPYGGQTGILILRVRAGASSSQDWAVWKQAVITPAGAPPAVRPIDIPPEKPIPGKPAKKPVPVEPRPTPPREKAEKVPYPLPSIPIEKIREANARINRYKIEIESVNSGVKYSGIVDEARELLYFRISLLSELPLTTKALVRTRNLRPADFYRISGKAYGRPLGNSTWVRVRLNGPFPQYLQEAMELLARGKIISISEEGDLWRIAIGVEEILSKLNAAEFSVAVLGEPETPKHRDLISSMMSGLAEIRVNSHMWVSRRDYQIEKLTTEIISSRGASSTDISFQPVRTGPPPLPKRVLETRGPEIPISMLLFRIPEDTGIGGWSDITHCSLALRSLQLVRDSDELGGPMSYYEVYHMALIPKTGEEGTCMTGKGEFIKPTESSHPVLIGNFYEDQKNRPGWKYSSGLEEFVIETIENPLEDVPVCRLVPEECNPAEQFYDRWLSPDNPDEYCPNCYSRPYHHYGTGDKGVPYNWFYIFWPPIPTRIYSARDRGHGGDRIIDPENPTRMTFIDGIEQYNKYTDQGKKNAYLMLGHVMHLLQDQAEPDHSRLVPHPASGKNEPDWYKEISLCEIRSVEAGANAFSMCPLGLRLTCFLIASGIAYGACQDSINKDDVGFEWLIDNEWDFSTREEASSRIEASGIRKQPNYDSFFQALGDYARQKVEDLGLESDYENSNSLGCGTLDIPPKIPAADPDIDKNNPREKNRYLELADYVASEAVCLGAGLLEYFYEIVNHPPYVKRIVVTTGDIGIPRLVDRREITDSRIKYDAHWQDIYDEETDKIVTLRAFRKMIDEPIDPKQEIHLYIELGPQLEPEKGKFASRIELKIGNFSATPTLRMAGDRRPVYIATIPAGAIAMNCGESELKIPVEIRAWDRRAHFGIRTATGEEIDANPISVAKVNTDSESFIFDGYEPGIDTSHAIRVAPINWEVAVSTNPNRVPPAGSPPWSMPTVRIGVPASGTKIDSIYMKVFSPILTGSPPVTVYVPTACPVHWTAGSVIGPSGEGSSEDLYHFRMNISNPDDAVAKLEIMTNPSTTRGTFTVMINYSVGTNHRTLGIPIQIY